MNNLPERVLQAIREHAKECYPLESCGVVVVKRGKPVYIACRNIASEGNFAIHPEDYADAEDKGKIALIVHSHPNVAPRPSPSDLIGCEKSGLPWLIVNWPTGKTYYFEPSGFELPLYGRTFNHGIIDCWTFVQDYYKKTLNIDVPHFDRRDNWWLAGENMYMDFGEEAGFRFVENPQQHDLVYMMIGSPVPNHAAIFLGDNTIGHHLEHRLSSCDVYGGSYLDATTHYLRHKDLM
jgi:proteasome lid subunit RPN8/RPN11